jgi:hypothetical protein
VTWVREKEQDHGEVTFKGSAYYGVELIRTSGWFAEPSLDKVPDFFQYGFYRYTKGLNKHWIWVRAVDDGMSHVILIQCKTKLGKKKKGKKKKGKK